MPAALAAELKLAIKEYDLPTPNVNPNTIMRFDPQTHNFARQGIPSGGGGVRNLVATPDLKLYLACSRVNKVAIVDLR